jgi:thiol:disulfide interchange protein DsbD
VTRRSAGALALLSVAAILFVGAADARAQTPIHFNLARIGTDALAPGKTFDAALKAEIDPTWHLYALIEPDGGPIATEITLGKGPFNLAGSIGSEDPKRALDPNFNLETPYYEERTTFTLPVRVGTAASAKETLRVIVHYQTCNDHLCLPPTDVELTLDVATGGKESASNAAIGAAGTATTPAAATGAAGLKPSPTTAGSPSDVAQTPAIAKVKRVVVDMAAASATASTLSSYIGLAMLMGALSLLTPCVFPMVPITVSYFTNRAGRSRRESVVQALVYGIGIVLTFTAVGFTLALGFGASGLNRFAADPWLNLGVTALFVFFALNLFGFYELALPSRLVNMAAKADEGKGRHVGTLLMGLAFTLTSFTCTAPFLGTLLVVAAQGQWQWPLAGMLAFSSVFALPFVILALVPQLLTSLPKSGSWLLAVKATMGLLELAAAMKFLSNVDLVWNWHVFTRTVVLLSWVLVAVALVAYLAGFIRLGHAPKLKRPGVTRLAGATAFAVLAVWLSLGAKGRSVGELEAFLPPDDLQGATTGGELPWILNDFDAGLAQARQQHRPLLIDFTGYTCTNCRWMEANMFTRDDVKRELARYVRVRLYTDGRGEMYKNYQRMQQQKFGTVALPYYAALASDGEPVVGFGGLTRHPEEFIAFLRRGLE